MTRTALALVLIVTGAVRLAAANDLTAVKALYSAADFEGALRLLAAASADDNPVEVEEYRALCLLALGRAAEAERSVEQIFARQPMYAVNTVELSPRMVTLVASVRQRLLPVLARNLYGLARKNFEHGEYAAAVAQLTEMRALIQAAGPNAALDDLRSVGTGFLDLARQQLAAVSSAGGTSPPGTNSAGALSRAAADGLPTPVYSEFLKLADEQSAAARAPVPLSTSASSELDDTVLVRPNVYSDADRIQPPVPVQRDVPRWTPPDATARATTHYGSLELVVDESGAVEAVAIVDSVHSAYDAALLEAARKWRYRPATRNGQPVRYRMRTPVVLRPPSP
jgi:protein TonB